MDMLTLITELAHNPYSHLAVRSFPNTDNKAKARYCPQCAQKSNLVVTWMGDDRNQMTVEPNGDAPLSATCLFCNQFIRKVKL